MKTILLLSIFLCLFTTNAYASCALDDDGVIRLTNCGAIADDMINDDAALLKAKTLAMQSGGTIRFPRGYTRLAMEHSFVGSSDNPVDIRLEGVKGSAIQMTGLVYILFPFGNNRSVEIDGITILGNPKAFTDAEHSIISAISGSSLSIKNTQILGTRSSNWTILATINTLIEHSKFDGNSSGQSVLGSFGAYQAGMTVRSSTFIDYASYRGMWMFKTYGGNPAWIRVTEGTVPNNAGGQRQLRIEDCVFDEGAIAAVIAQNVMFVEISGSNSNVSGTEGGVGFYFDNVRLARVEGVWGGWTGYARPLITAVNNTYVAYRGVQTAQSVFLAKRDQSSQILGAYCAGNCQTQMIK